MIKTWAQRAFGSFASRLAMWFGLANAFVLSGLCSSTALGLEPPGSSAFEEAPVLVRRLPAVVNQPPSAVEGVENLSTESGELIERLPAAINNLPLPIDPRNESETPAGNAIPSDWSPSDITDENVGELPRRVDESGEDVEFHESELHLLGDEPFTTLESDMSSWTLSPPFMSPPLVPPPFMPPLTISSEPQSVDEFLPQTYHPPVDPQTGTVPRAYVPPPVESPSQDVQWSPWWDEPLGRVSLLSAPTIPVNLQELMNLSLRNSPVVQIVRNETRWGHDVTSKSRIDRMLYSVAQYYWETYRLRGIVIVRERLYQDALVVCRQLKTLVGKDDDLLVLSVTSARERLAELAAAHAVLRKAQNKLASVVSLPNWEQELELLPMDSPFYRPYRIDEAAELRSALSRRAEMQGMINSIQAASYHPRMRRMMVTAPIQVHSIESPELEEISDRIKLEVKNAIVRVAGSYETMRRFSNAAQSSAQEVATLQARCAACTGSTRDLPLFFRDLLDAQSRLAEIEQRFVTAQANYSASILELRRANGTIIDRCTFDRGGPVRGPGISNPRTVNAVWHAAPQRYGAPLEPSGDIFQSPQERLQGAPGFDRRESGKRETTWQLPSSDGQPGSLDRTPGETSPSAPTQDQDVPRGELPMPAGERLLPRTPNSNATFPGLKGPSNELAFPSNRLSQESPQDISSLDRVPSGINRRVAPTGPQRNSLEPYDFGGFGGESTLNPPLQVSPSSGRSQSHFNGLRDPQLPGGELPMPRGEDLIQSATPNQLWQLGAQPTTLRESRRRY